MNTLLCLLLGLGGGDLDPVEVPWSEFTAGYLDPARVLPVPTAADLEAGGKPTIDLAKAMKELAGKRFASSPSASAEWATFGDLAAAFRPLERDATQTNALLAKLEHEHPEIWSVVSGSLPELVRASGLLGKDWDPGEDQDDDGMLTAAPWTITRSPDRSSFWNQLDADRDVCQAAVLIYADLEALQRAEYDYAHYKSHVGNPYVQIYPVPGSLVFGRDAAGRDFFGLQLAFENHVPFPFSNIKAELTLADHFDQDGTLLSDAISTSEKFYWLAGRDSLFPVQTSKGALVGYLMVRTTGLDARGLPDRFSDHMKSVRGALGNRKRDAEALCPPGKELHPNPGRLPRVPFTSLKD
jgi:hypothetical protein